MKLASWRRWWPPRAYLWVGLMTIVYVAIALGGTWINYIELHVNAGGVGLYDLGINQQALASAYHRGAPYPLYEATSCGRTARCSLLLTHPIFFAYVIAAPYALAPSAFTLFAFQDAALGLAALPLFAIGRRLLGSDRWALVATGVYLAWLPPFTGIFSFHWEAFIPVELFTVAYLWLSRRYWLAVPVILLTYVTLEVTPVLLFFLGIFFLWDWFVAFLRYLSVQTRYFLMRKGSSDAQKVRAGLRHVRRGLLKSPAVRATLLLMGGSVLAYLALHEIVQHGGALIGLPSLPPEYQIPVTQPAHSATVTLGSLGYAWQAKLTFWIVIFATLGLIPFLAPRALIIALPWVLYSSITTPGFYRMGDQYAFVTAAVLFIPFVYGLARLTRWTRAHTGSERPVEATSGEGSTSALGVAVNPPISEPTSDNGDRSSPAAPTALEPIPPAGSSSVAEGTEPAPAIAATASGPADSAASEGRSIGPRMYRGLRRRLRSRQLRTAALGVLLAAILAFNVLLNPFDPLASEVQLQRPFLDQSGLALGSSVNATSYRNIERLVALIPAQAPLAAAPTLFTYVATDLQAYPLYGGMNYWQLPGNLANRTQYLLTNLPYNSPETLLLEKKSGQNFSNPAVWGIRAWTPDTSAGAITLLEKGYTGSTETIGGWAPSALGTFVSGQGLNAGIAGASGKNASSSSGHVVHSRSMDRGTLFPVVNGTVSIGPVLNLNPGSYRLTVNLSGRTSHPMSSSENVSQISVTGDLGGFDPVPISPLVLYLDNFTGGGWKAFTMNFTLTSAVPALTIATVGEPSWFYLQVNYVALATVSAP